MDSKVGKSIKIVAIIIAFVFVGGGAIVAISGGIQYGENADYLKYASINGGGSGYSSLEKAGNEGYAGLQKLQIGIAAAVSGFFFSILLFGFGELIETNLKMYQSMLAIQKELKQ